MALSIPAAAAPKIINFVRTTVMAAVVAAAAPEAAAIGGSILLVAGAYAAAGLAYHYFSQENRNRAIALAKDRYCSMYSELSICKASSYNVYGIRYYAANGQPACTYGLLASNVIFPYGWQIVRTNNNYCNTYLRELYALDANGNRKGIENTSGSGIAFYLESAGEFNIVATEAPQDAWKNWSDADRQKAIAQLSDDDWKSIIDQMPQGGTLQSGQVLPNQIMTTENGEIYQQGTKILSPQAAEIYGALKGDLDSLKGEIRDLPYSLNHQGLSSIGASIAGLTGIARNTDRNVAKLGETITEAQKANNDNFNDLKKRAKNISVGINWDRFLLLMTWWQTLHNCQMLSADIARSLVSSVETALAALPGDSLLGVPTEDPDGTPLDVGKTISTSFEGFVKGAIGAENYAELKLDLARINRIYQATTNLLNQVQSLTNDLQNIATLTGENTSRIGNALTRFGVVGEDAYKAMDEDLDSKTSFIHRLQAKLEAGQSVASNLEAIVQSVYSTEQTLIEIQNQSIEFKKAVKDIMPKNEPENKPVAQQIQLNKEASQSPTISPYDLNKV